MFEIRESSQYGAFLFSFESDSAKLNQTPIWIIWAISGWEVQPLQTSSCWWARERDAGRSHWDSWWLWLVQQIGRKGQESPWEEGRRLEGRDLCEEGWQSSLFFPPAMSSPNPPEIVAPFFSNLPNPQVWAPKTPSFSLPSSNLFPVPRYQRKGEALEWFCHKEKEKSKTPNQTKPNNPNWLVSHLKFLLQSRVFPPQGWWDKGKAGLLPQSGRMPLRSEVQKSHQR